MVPRKYSPSNPPTREKSIRPARFAIFAQLRMINPIFSIFSSKCYTSEQVEINTLFHDGVLDSLLFRSILQLYLPA